MLIDSIKRRPTIHKVCILKCIMNGIENSDDYLEIMKNVDIEEVIEDLVNEFIDVKKAI